MEESFISFHDLTPRAHYVFASPSIKLLMGFEPEEVLGLPAYDFFYPEDIEACHRVHAATVTHTKVGTVCFFRIKHKLGHYIRVVTVSNYCNNYIACVTNKADVKQFRLERDLSFDEVIIVERNKLLTKSWNYRDHRLLSIPEFFVADQNRLKETRVLMILNRFTEELEILYVTQNIDNLIPGLDSSRMVRQKLMSFVHPSCQSLVMTEIMRAKACNGVCHVRFPWNSPPHLIEGSSREIDVEMIVACSADGLLGVVRELKSLVPLEYSDQRNKEAITRLLCSNSSEAYQPITNDESFLAPSTDAFPTQIATPTTPPHLRSYNHVRSGCVCSSPPAGPDLMLPACDTRVFPQPSFATAISPCCHPHTLPLTPPLHPQAFPTAYFSMHYVDSPPSASHPAFEELPDVSFPCPEYP